jgi:hypothetical protein
MDGLKGIPGNEKKSGDDRETKIVNASLINFILIGHSLHIKLLQCFFDAFFRLWLAVRTSFFVCLHYKSKDTIFFLCLLALKPDRKGIWIETGCASKQKKSLLSH